MLDKFKFIIVLIMAMSIYSVNIFAQENKTTYLRVEGINKTIMEGNVEEDTFVKALQKLGLECGIEVIMKNDSQGQQLHSIDGIENNKYGLKAGWKFYIVRNKEIINIDDINNTAIGSGDELVVYYGDNQLTKKINDIKSSYDNSNLILEFISSITTWVEENGVWNPKTLNNTLENVSAHLLTDDGRIITKKVDSNGKVIFNLKSPNICVYYADGYQDKNVPTIVKTNTIKEVIGIDSTKNLTRAEMIATLVNYFEIEVNDKVKIVPFSDISEDNLYREQIYIAVSNSIINGDGNNCFNPDNEITMQELAIILYKIYENKQDSTESIEVDDIDLKNASEWAKPFIISVIQKGIIKNTDIDWIQPVTANDILEILVK